MMPDPTPPRVSGYHHGHLREALIAAAVQLIKEGGPDNVSVREAAKRAGVSAGAPFRHFKNKTALMTAVAEQAMSRFSAEIAEAVASVTTDDPLDRFAAIGVAYLRWATRNPTHFQIVSTRSLIDWEGSASLRRDNEAVRALMEEAMLNASQRNMLRSDDLAHGQIAARAMVYGLGRMFIDGHFAQWAVEGEAVEGTMQKVLDLFLSLMRNDETRSETPGFVE